MDSLLVRLIWLLLAMSLVASGAYAEGDGAVTVARVLSGNLLELDDGRLVRLAGIRLPAAANGRATEDLARAQAALAGLVERRAVRLEPAEPALDRHGRHVAQVWRHDGLWLQGALLEGGLVQVQTRPGEAALAAEMAAREQAARSAEAGIWTHRRFAPRSAHQVGALIGSFQIVQGRVVRVAPAERFIYLNFGGDWRADFTLRVARSSVRSFREAGIELEQLAGRDVEVRGYVLEAGGPLIELSHPEQIRIRTEPGPAQNEPAS
jgi:micrococcal nuclease